MKHTAFKITLGNEEFFEVMSNPWTDTISNPKDMSVSLLFSKDRPVVFQDTENPAKRLVIMLVDVDIDEQGTLEYKPL
jgi:hypothetical protein